MATSATLATLASPLECLPNTYRAFFSGFATLTTAQQQLIQPILHGKDVVLQASTGSGKTEAVLAPATEKLITHTDYFTIVYIVPTRALSLDMNRRIKPIYKKLGLKSGMRTGDGKDCRDATPHLLIMTPESLDVMLGSQNNDNKHFLKHAHIIIIDEVHVFLGDNRGRQLAYLHHRLTMQSVAKLQTIALSATIDNAEDITRLFNLSNPPFFYKQAVARKLNPCWVHIEDEECELVPFFDDLYRQYACKKLLVFANSRKKCEQLYDILNQDSAFSRKVFLHYSNLSTRERKFIEASFRDGKIGVCIATSTLELGIDIGDIDGIVLIGPPPSTMAFLQRLGRGNRRSQHINFWGVCYGPDAERQLIRFLAFFELAKKHRLEKCCHAENYSVLFQQILSCLYAKKALSQNSLSILFKDKSADLSAILQHMLAKNWLKSSKQAGIYEGGWRYFSSLQKKQIWSNFPPIDEEYDVILDYEKIAVLPLSMVRQLEIGDIMQLTGKVLKTLQIEEKKAAREVWVAESHEAANKELIWCGFGALIPVEVAQTMAIILAETSVPAGLLKRTQRLLESAREKIAQSLTQPNGIKVHRLGSGVYRYETFLGSVGNYILYNLIKMQFSAKLAGLSVNFDEIGLECNEWISFELLEIPHTLGQFQQWISNHLSLLRHAFPWNSWLHWLPEAQQQQEIGARLYDARVLEHFQRYHAEPRWLPLPIHTNDDTKMVLKHLPLKGEPWSVENEKQTWGMLTFPKLAQIAQLAHEKQSVSLLTATQVQAYVTQKLCPRWARLQRLGYKIESHPRFYEIDQEIQSRRQQGIAFKNQVIDVLQNSERVCFETPEFTWQQAIKTVASDKQPMFLARSKLEVELPLHVHGGKPQHLRGRPDLIYIKHQGSHICVEVWDIKFSHSISYAQKWRIAFYTYLLERMLNTETFLLPVQVSALGGLIYTAYNEADAYNDAYNEDNEEKLFDKAPFVLAAYKAWMPRLIEQWQADSGRSAAIENYSMEFSCTSCCYFSYCYQETLFKDAITNLPGSLTTQNERTIIAQNIASNDFPSNAKHWYFVHYDNKIIQWQCWENGEVLNDHHHCLRVGDFASEEVFRAEAARQLHKEWNQSFNQGKNPHLLVYEATDWYRLQKDFQLTILKSIWARHVCWTAVQTIVKTHFLWPIQGRITAQQIGACLGLARDPTPPLSLYHRESFSNTSFDLYRQIWSWCLANVKSKRVVSFKSNKAHQAPLIQDYLAVHHRETECRTFEIVEFQKNPLPERVQQCRALGPLSFLGKAADKKCYQFSLAAQSTVSKFRVGDFLKLSPAESKQVQNGVSVILETYLPEQGTLTVRPLSQKVGFSRNQLYALDEDATDWNAAKIAKVLNLLQDRNFNPALMQMLLGNVAERSIESVFTKSSAVDDLAWIGEWYQAQAAAAGLNYLQQQALTLPFREKIGLIEGPPGTGKTHLLVWTLIALIAHAKFFNRSIKILVTAQTHHAIDQILKKVAKMLPMATVSNVALWKYGRFDDSQFSALGIGQIQNSDTLNEHSCLILGATGFGVYQLLEAKKFPKLFDWVIFDESSQILTSYAILSLIFGKGQALFYGDTQQLSPIVKENYETTAIVPMSILQELIARYGVQHRLRLNETYRMNADICKFASEQWYDGELRSVVDKKNQNLELLNYPLFKDRLDDYLDPSKSMVVVQLDHVGSQQSSPEEALWIATAVMRLINDYAISSEQIGIISPHRLQNNTIISALKKVLPCSLTLPRVDTVERMQGAEFDIVIFSATSSDKDTIHSSFLKEYRRFNVALTRSRKKIIFVASALFFQAFPTTEKELVGQMPFENFFCSGNL